MQIFSIPLKSLGFNEILNDLIKNTDIIKIQVIPLKYCGFNYNHTDHMKIMQIP